VVEVSVTSMRERGKWRATVYGNPEP
jgi:hypothetical protein